MKVNLQGKVASFHYFHHWEILDTILVTNRFHPRWLFVYVPYSEQREIGYKDYGGILDTLYFCKKRSVEITLAKDLNFCLPLPMNWLFYYFYFLFEISLLIFRSFQFNFCFWFLFYLSGKWIPLSGSRLPVCLVKPAY